MNKPNMQRIPDQRMISAIGYKDGTALQRGFPGGGIPYLNDAFEYWNGSILDVAGTKYFTGKNGHNLLITGYDFDSTWLKGFPYKSAATVSAPAGDAAFIAADLNNFFYDSGGTPNQIPVVSLFQNVDYAGRLFCKHQAQTVDYTTQVETFEPRVKEIILYNTTKTSTQLTQCNSYFDVPTKQTSNIREVGAGKTYTTIEAAITAASAGDLIYIYTGVYTHASTYFTFAKALTFYGLGRVECKQPSTTTVFYQNKVNATYRNLIINCESKTTNAITTEAHTVDDAYQCNVYNCYFSNINTRINAGSRGYVWYVKNCIAEKATSYVWGSYGTNSTYYGNRIKNAVFSHTFGAIYKYNRVEMSIVTAHDAITISNNNYTFLDNDFIFTSGGIRSTGTYTTRTATSFTYNKFYLKNNTANAAISAINLTDAFVLGQTNIIKNNYISDIQTLTSSGVKTCIGILNNAATIEENIIVTTTDADIRHISVDFNANGNLATYSIKKNIVMSNFSGGSSISVTIGRESAYDNCHVNSIIEHNYISNAGASSGLHGILINCGINAHIRYNKVTGRYYGIIVKTGTTAKTYTTGGVYYNVISECAEGIRIKGVSGMNVFGNTYYNSTVGGAIGVYCDENNVIAGDQFSENIIIKNNILTNTIASGSLVKFDAHAAANGCIAEYNQLYGGQYLLSDGTDYTSLATAQAANKLLNCVVGNPNLTAGLWPLAPISIGEDLGADYDDGLDISTNWGSATTVPTVVTKQQSGTWQVGAYIQ